MCCCQKPTINGQLGYRYDCTGGTAVYPVNPPSLAEGETIIFDEPGRCGGVDSHAYHYRVVTGPELLVRHGMGEERISYLSNGKKLVEAMKLLDSDARYWVMNAIYHAQKSAARNEGEKVNAYWQKAAAEKRIRTRKYPSRNTIKVWIE